MEKFILENEPQIVQYSRDFIRHLNIDHKKNIVPVFLSLAGSHLYGFPSRDSDYDIRGVYASSLDEVLGLERYEEHIGEIRQESSLELDISMHELKPFLRKLAKPDGNFLEQLYSPYVLLTSDEHQELKKISQGLVCKKLFNHYYSFGRRLRREGEDTGIVKSYIYAMRAYMVGINTLTNGSVISDINILNEDFKLPIVRELVRAKLNREVDKFQGNDSEIKSALDQLETRLEKAYTESKLPEEPRDIRDINNSLIKFRKKQLDGRERFRKTLYTPEEQMLEFLRLYAKGEIPLERFAGLFSEYYEEEYVRDESCPIEDKPELYENIYNNVCGFLRRPGYQPLGEAGLKEIIEKKLGEMRVEKRMPITIDY